MTSSNLAKMRELVLGEIFDETAKTSLDSVPDWTHLLLKNVQHDLPSQWRLGATQGPSCFCPSELVAATFLSVKSAVGFADGRHFDPKCAKIYGHRIRYDCSFQAKILVNVTFFADTQREV